MAGIYAHSPTQWLAAMQKFIHGRDLEEFVTTMTTLNSELAVSQSGGIMKMTRDWYQRWSHQGGVDREVAGLEWDAIVEGRLQKHSVGVTANNEVCVCVVDMERSDWSEKHKAVGERQVQNAVASLGTFGSARTLKR